MQNNPGNIRGKFVTKFWKKFKDDYSSSVDTAPFSQWAIGKDFFSHTVDPWERTKKLLIEIQKRSLAEQVILLSWNKKDTNYKVLCMTPSGEKSIINKNLEQSLIQKCYEEDRLLVWEDFYEDSIIEQDLRNSNCDTLLLSPVSMGENYFDLLLIVNYSGWGETEKIVDFITFVTSVLAFSLQNFRLYLKLQHRNIELKDWTEHVEERIEDGTKRLLEKEFQYYALFEGTNDGIIVHDASGQVIEVNRVVCKLLGYDKKEMLRINWEKLSPSCSISGQHNYFDKVLKRVNIDTIETTLRKKNGSIFTAELSSRSVRFRGKQTIQTFIRDISLQKKLQVSLRESKEKYRTLVESSLVGVFIIRNGIIQFVNSRFEEITGYSHEELLEKKFVSLIVPEYQNMVSTREKQRENGEKVLDHYEIPFIKKCDERFWGDMHLGRIILDGRPAVFGNVIDITHSKQLERQILDSKKMESIGTLAGGVAHDFNNLLGGILGYASLILSEMSEDNKYYDDVNSIAETAKRAADLTNRLLAFARGGKYRVVSINMNDIIKGVVEKISPMADQKVKINTELEIDLWKISGDNQQLFQTVLNICLNSLDALQDGGELNIETANVEIGEGFEQARLQVSPMEYVRIVIDDTREGMDAKTKSRMFEPFFTTKTSGEGVGMGLAMVYGVIKNHDGAIWVDSVPGEGTKLMIYLPKYIEIPDIQRKISKPVEVKKDKILLVDDEKVIREVASRMLEKGGFQVLLADNGKKALEIYKKEMESIGLVILDYVMPLMGGKETYRRLREIDPDVLVGFTSGYNPIIRPYLISLGKEYFIQKPFQTENLIRKVRQMLKISNENCKNGT